MSRAAISPCPNHVLTRNPGNDMRARPGLYSALVVALLATALASCGNESARDNADIAPTPSTEIMSLGTPSTAGPSVPTASSPPRSSVTGTSTIPPTSAPWTPISSTQPATNGTTTSRPPTKPGKSVTSRPTSAPPTTRNPCGPAPSGRASDGRSLQKIYFPDPGVNHQWPDRSVRLKACSTSGLPITYRLQDGRTCHVEDPSANPLQSQSYELSCAITATQAGDPRFAPAAPVTRTWAYGKLVITLAWTGPDAVLKYDASNPVVTLPARATAIHPFPSLSVYAGIDAAASTSCSAVTSPGLIGGSDQTSFDLTVHLTLTDPGTKDGICQLYINCQVDQTITYDNDIRRYTVRRS